MNILNPSLKKIIENLVERKMRLTYNGYKCVGNSTVLNSIIEDNLLLPKDTENTYRGIINKNKQIRNPQLWRAQMKIICSGTSSDYYKFEEVELYCDGNEKTKAYLSDKNNKWNFMIKIYLFEFMQNYKYLILSS